MEIILKDDVAGLGYRNDMLTVKNGYATNFLIPQGLAIAATESNKKVAAENIRQASHKAEKIRMDAVGISERIGDLTIELRTKAGESGKIFGKITTLQIADALKARGFEVDRRKIEIGEDIKQLGSYDVTLNLHREVKHVLHVTVVEE
jgi:large subunit ribosomal protein L9